MFDCDHCVTIVSYTGFLLHISKHCIYSVVNKSVNVNFELSLILIIYV